MKSMATSNNKLLSAHLGMLVCALIVGLSFPAVGLLSDGLPPLLLTSLRFLIAALALLPLLLAQPERWLRCCRCCWRSLNAGQVCLDLRCTR